MMHIIPDKTVLLRQKGVYTQVPLYVFNKRVYAGFGKGFIKLFKTSVCGTSKPEVHWVLESLQIQIIISKEDNNALVYEGETA